MIGGYPEQVRSMVAPIYGQYNIYIWQSPEGGIWAHRKGGRKKNISLNINVIFF
jgi:hypothetical protein